MWLEARTPVVGQMAGLGALDRRHPVRLTPDMIRPAPLSMLLLTLAPAAFADPIAGQASVIDGDTIEIHGERIRLLDIDAPESDQTCTRPDGPEWRCGQQVALKLSGWIGKRTVTCDADRKDRYGRWLANCEAGGEDMARWLASRGWAVPYRDCKCEVIREASDYAKNDRSGIWNGTFQMPWDWRKAN